MTQICSDALEFAQIVFPDEGISAESVHIAVVRLDRTAREFQLGGVGLDAPIYPASVVKVFYLAFAAHLLDSGSLAMSPELNRASRDMVKDSNNDATGYIVDLVCGTTPGPELGPADLARFIEQRGAVNRFFSGLGYQGVNAVNRTFNEGPYGRESQLLGKDMSNRNRVTASAVCRLMAEIALGTHWSGDSVSWMQGLLRRANPQDEPDAADAQASGFIGKAIPRAAILYSKAGWTSDTRHDAAWVVLPDGREFAIAILTKHGSNLGLVGAIAGHLFQGLGYAKAESSGETSG
ncbi:MAG: serine hydrolase [Armatimonadetes bacterium]|nr:serine hydrolase [Armatimonadota bacterium]